MASSSDEYDAYNLDEFTEEEFAYIESGLLIRDTSSAQILAGGPAVTIEVEQSTDCLIVKDSSKKSTSKSGARQEPHLSPFRQFRSWKKVLSVSDLVSPAWCEVQFDYGLRQKRFKKLEQRPASFTTSEGKKITVKKKVAAKNDERLKRGHSLHKILEKEIRPVEVQVNITTDEERWALRLVNMISGLQSLMELGCTREMPVFGIVHDQLVVGIIDELLRQPVLPAVSAANGTKRASESLHATPKSKKTRRTSPPSQSQITSFLVASPEKVSGAMDPPDRPSTPTPIPLPTPVSTLMPIPNGYTLHLLDTKTRKSRSLPDDVDTKSSRLQLMLYHRLLSPLIADEFDFDALWKRIGLDPKKCFSARFQSQAGLIFASDDVESDCLEGLARMWGESVRRLDVAGIHGTLVLVYRTQPKRKGRSKSKKKWKTKGAEDVIDTLANQEDLDLARAIEDSMKDMIAGPHTVHESLDYDLVAAIAESLKEQAASSPSDKHDKGLGPLAGGTGPGNGGIPDAVSEGQNMFQAMQESLAPQSGKEVDSAGSDISGEESSNTSTPSRGASGASKNSEDLIIIGTKEFSVDNTFLDNYLTAILQWWHGQRQPQGVEVELSRRCFTCEYMDGCEWREQKANKANQKFEEKMMAAKTAEEVAAGV